MPPAPNATASGEAGFLASLTRTELADLWVTRLQRAHREEASRGRRRVWTRVGQRDEIRVVENEFQRRVHALEEERQAYLDLFDQFDAHLWAEESAPEPPSDDDGADHPDEDDGERNGVEQDEPVGDPA